MYGIGAGCPGANVLGHHRMGRLTLEHRLNHPRPKEIVTFLSSTSYTAPVGALYADVIVVGNGGAGSDGTAGSVLGVGLPVTPIYGGNGGAGGGWGSQDAIKLVLPTFTVVVGLVSSFHSVSTAAAAGPVGGAGGASYSAPAGFTQPGTAGGNGVTGSRLLFTGVLVCASGGGGGGSGWVAVEPSQMTGFIGGAPYGGTGGGKFGAAISAGSNGSPAAAGSGGGGGGGGCGLLTSLSGYAYATAGGQGGAGGTGVVQIRFRREF